MTPISVTVVYASPAGATEVEVSLPPGATVADAVERSGIALRHPEANAGGCPVGIFGRIVDRAASVAEGDRVELYRPLVADAMQTRRRRAKRAQRR